MADHTEAGVQALLDTTGTGKGIRILRHVQGLSTASPAVHSYYCHGGNTYPGRVRWVNTTTTATDAQVNTAIRTALAA